MNDQLRPIPQYAVLIVGAGQAGAQAAICLRQGGFAGPIALVGDEAELPYERPPLSKDYLSGARAPQGLLLRPHRFWDEHAVSRWLGERVIEVDPEARQVRTAAGRVLGYERLVWAAGGSPRPLPAPGGNLRGVHCIRTRVDVDRLRSELPRATRVVVIGAGYIGLEAAAVLTKLGKQVHVLEAQTRVLARVTTDTVSRFYEREHRKAGVDIRLGVSVSELVGEEGRVRRVRFRGGLPDLDCELVIVGIGIQPAVEPLAAAGAAVGDGVRVDEFCRTSLPGIYAIGDCANHVNAFAGGARIRLESVQNAVDQAKVVANALLGDSRSYRATPWFWSNQYHLKLQTIGLQLTHDSVVLRGDPDEGSFSVIYLKDSRVIALDCVNSMRDFVQGRALVEAGTRADPGALANRTIPLKSLVTTPAPSAGARARTAMAPDK